MPEADQTAFLTTAVPCDRPDLWEQMGRQLFRQAENPICGYGVDPPRLRVHDDAAAEILRNQLPSNIREDMEIELGCPQLQAGTHSNEPDLGNDDANTIAREMLDIGAGLGVSSFSVAANPDGSIVICIWDSEPMATRTEERARELNIEATVATDCSRPVPYGS